MDITVMENLPTEMLLYIFEMLSYRDLKIAMLVCRRWREIGEIQQLWGSLPVIVNKRNISVMPEILSTRRILYCTALFCTILYKKRRMKEEKIRKFAYTQTKNTQTDRQRIQTLRPPFSRWSRDRESSRANNCTVLHSSVLYCIKRGGWKREKWENLQTHKEQSSKQAVQTLRPPFSRWSRDRESSRANLLTSTEQSSKQSDGSKTETTLILCGYSRELANISTSFY